MNKILMMLSLLVSTNVLAVDWVKADEGTFAGFRFTGYIDQQSIRRDGNKARLSTLHDLKSGKVLSNNKTYLSTVARSEYDCFENTVRAMDVNFYSGKMGTGDIVLSAPNRTDQTISVPQGSIFATELKIACATK
jgi:hypothetical protein